MLSLATACGAAALVSVAGTFAGVEAAADFGWYLSMLASALATAGSLGHIAFSNNDASRKFTNGQALPSGGRGLTSSSRGQYQMEDFGLMKGSKFSFKDEWGGNPVISEVATEKTLNQDGLRYRMAPTEAEERTTGKRWNSIWQALGFTATSNNEARQIEKMRATEAAANVNNEEREEYLNKYGYPRLVGTKGIFYADQLSSDAVPMGGFNMGKSGKMWGTPEVVEEGMYGGAKGWGMKKEKKSSSKKAAPKKGDLFGR